MTKKGIKKFFVDFLPDDALGKALLGIVVLVVVLAASCVRRLDTSYHQYMESEDQKTRAAGYEVGQHFFIDMGAADTITVVHDSKHEVTCWASGTRLACLPDKDVKRQ